MNTDMAELERLGRVDPPLLGVLDAAREVLWSAVAAEMLATAPPGAGQAPGESAARRTGETPARRTGETPARQPSREDPGVQ